MRSGWFWRLVGGLVAGCCVVVTGVLVYQYRYQHLRDREEHGDVRRVSADYRFVKPYGASSGRLEQVSTGRITLDDVDWVAVSVDDDSLAVYSKDGLRGYFNRFSGEVSIPAQYLRAWVFSDGVAAVSDGDCIYFIDHDGQPVNGKRFPYRHREAGYLYHGGYCAMHGDDGLMGLIDRRGEWAVEPRFQIITSETRDYWKAREGDHKTGLWYAIDDSARLVTERGYPELSITEDAGIVATLPDHRRVSYGFDGVMSDELLIYGIDLLRYPTGQNDASGQTGLAIATLMSYSMPDGYRGLCTAGGQAVTAPLYGEISAVGKDLYLCTYKGTDDAVIVNSHGETVRSGN